METINESNQERLERTIAEIRQTLIRLGSSEPWRKGWADQQRSDLVRNLLEFYCSVDPCLNPVLDMMSERINSLGDVTSLRSRNDLREIAEAMLGVALLYYVGTGAPSSGWPTLH
jgi:hypothetical protein